jgi:O-antigen ligase
VLTGVLYLIHWRKPKLQLPAGTGKILALAFGAGVLTVLVGMVYFTCIDPQSAPWELLRLDDGWGSHRGYMWRHSMDIFRNYTWKERLLGSGPDTFYLVFEPYFEGLAQYGDNSTNAAHNEYLNYLITQGIVGLGAYLALVIGCVIQALRQAKKEPYYMVFLSAVLCYGVQALVNIAQPITTPLFVVFLGLCASKIPKKGRKIPEISYKKRRKRSD